LLKHPLEVVMKTNGKSDTKVARVPRRAVGNRPVTRLPTDAFLCAALGSMALSVLFQTVRLRKSALLVAQWVPALLLLGMYNKMLEVAEENGASSARLPARD
jgi:hypothetical protein